MVLIKKINSLSNPVLKCSQIMKPIIPSFFWNLQVQVTKNIHTTESNNFWQSHKKAPYHHKQLPQPPKIEMIKEGFKELKTEIQVWKDEVKEHFESDPILIYRPGEIDRVWEFVNNNSLDRWNVTSDSDHNEGFSHCKLETTSRGTALFSGVISTEIPKDGRLKKAGYCNITSFRAQKSFKRDTYYDWTAYTYLVIKCRGDGRSYSLNLATEGYFDILWNDIYHYVLYTRGGPYWQVTKVPFSKFFLAAKGRVQDKQKRIPLNKISRFGITAADKIDGPFQLELAYIGLEYDPNYKEEFAYELYKMPYFVVGD